MRSVPKAQNVIGRGIALGSCEIDDQSPSAANLKSERTTAEKMRAKFTVVENETSKGAK